MKHTKLIKATLGAGLLVALSGTVALAHPAGEQTHVSVTVQADTESIALSNDCVVVLPGSCDNAFNVGTTWVRDTTGRALVNADLYTQHLDYVTDYSGQYIYVAAAAVGDSELGATSVTLNVTAGAPTGLRDNEGTGSGSTQALDTASWASLITGIDGYEGRVDASSALSFSADIGIDADRTTHTFTLTYELGAD
jgi:hypothetical protein